MLSAYQLLPGDKVLLLGEGNFSFSKDLVIFNLQSLREEFSKINITSTCREGHSEKFSEFKQDNIKFLLSKGVSVLFNVDATNLESHPPIRGQKYSKVIFNFPHVGGKMKIHLNRKLLKDFFSSAYELLEESGSIVVTLCDGQGGTDADKKRRNWNDTWQITEMAAYSDLILYKVELFDATNFPNYVNVGYRSCEKSFHCENAIVHLFRKQRPPRILSENPDTWTKVEGPNESLIIDALNKRLVNPWSNIHSASTFIYQHFLGDIDSSFFECTSVMEYSCQLAAENLNPLLDDKDMLFSLMEILNSAKQECTENTLTICKVLMTRKPVLLKDFSSPPVRCQVLMFGRDISHVLSQCLIDLLELFHSNCEIKISNREECLQSISLSNKDTDHPSGVSIIDKLFLPNGMQCHIIHIDELAQVLFKINDWHSLWDGKVDVSSTKIPLLYPTVMFPKEYAFDLGLSVPLEIKDEFEEYFFLTLWVLAGDIIVKVEHLTTYNPTDRELICYCYRITYKSHVAPMYRKRVIYFHENIVAKIVSRTLQVNIT